MGGRNFHMLLEAYPPTLQRVPVPWQTLATVAPHAPVLSLSRPPNINSQVMLSVRSRFPSLPLDALPTPSPLRALCAVFLLVHVLRTTVPTLLFAAYCDDCTRHPSSFSPVLATKTTKSRSSYLSFSQLLATHLFTRTRPGHDQPQRWATVCPPRTARRSCARRR